MGKTKRADLEAVGSRLELPLFRALVKFTNDEDRSISSYIRLLISKDLQKRGYLSSD